MFAEYLGEIPADKREGVVQQLNEEVKRLIEVGSSEQFLYLKAVTVTFLHSPSFRKNPVLM